MPRGLILVLALLLFSWPLSAPAADKFVTIHSSRVMSQSMPWMAQEAGLFKKYNLDHELVFICLFRHRDRRVVGRRCGHDGHGRASAM